MRPEHVCPAVGLALPSVAPTADGSPLTPADLTPGAPCFHDVVASDDLDTLHAAAVHSVPLGLWVVYGPLLPDIPEESLLPIVAAILTPWPTMARRISARWPAYAARTWVVDLPVAPGEAPSHVGEREPRRPVPGWVLWTGRGEPGPEEQVRLLAGPPIAAPARGILRDLVARAAGVLVPDLLGSDRELALLDEATTEAPAPAGPSADLTLYDAAVRAFQACPLDPVELPALEADAEGIVQVPRSVPRSQAALALERRYEIHAFDAGAEADRYQVTPREDPLPVPPLARLRPVRVAGTLLLGQPRATLPEAVLSLRGAVDRLVVAYTGPRDPRVPDLAREIGVPVREVDVPGWDGDFAAARNAALDEVDEDYLLAIDDDERLVGPDALRSALRGRVPSGLRLRLYNLGERALEGEQIAIRVFRADPRFRYFGPLHEVVEGDGFTVCSVGRPYLVHYGYTDPRVLDARYRARNLPIVARHLARDPRNRRLACVELRDAVAARDRHRVAEAALLFQEQIVAAERWAEFVAWGEVFAEALQQLGRGVAWSPDLSMPGADVRRPMRLGFLSSEDLRRFLAWWTRKSTRIASGLLGEEPPT